MRSFLQQKRDGRLEEHEIKPIFKQIVKAISYCHQHNIAHRDIKLENILIINKKQVKLIDFGFSINLKHKGRLNLFCGTPSYMPPEIVSKVSYYGKPADIWALGILLYKMLAGYFPFKGRNDRDLFRKIKQGNFSFPKNISDDLKELLRSLLKVAPSERITAKEVSSVLLKIDMFKDSEMLML